MTMIEQFDIERVNNTFHYRPGRSRATL